MRVASSSQAENGSALAKIWASSLGGDLPTVEAWRRVGWTPQKQQGKEHSNSSPLVKKGRQKFWGIGLCLYLC